MNPAETSKLAQYFHENNWITWFLAGAALFFSMWSARHFGLWDHIMLASIASIIAVGVCSTKLTSALIKVSSLFAGYVLGGMTYSLVAMLWRHGVPALWRPETYQVLGTAGYVCFWMAGVAVVFIFPVALFVMWLKQKLLLGWARA